MQTKQIHKNKGIGVQEAREKNKENLINLLQNSRIHSRNELTKVVMSCYSGDSYGDSNWQKVISAWGDSPEKITLHGEFVNQYPHLAQLNLDQGLITHLPEFMEFLKTYDSNTKNYLAIREDFKQFLGNKIVWRGMILTEKEAKKIKTNGIESSFLRKTKDMPAKISNFEANVLSVRFNELVEKHFHGENYHSPLISVSSHENVAIAVGRHFGNNSPSEDPKEFYLCKMNIPERDLIYYSDHAIRTPYKLQGLIKNETPLCISVNGDETSYQWDREVESYLMYKVSPEEIIEISKPIINKSSWNGKISI